MAKITITKKHEIEIKRLKASLGIRVWEDAKVNGKEIEQGTEMPLAINGRWEITINLDTGIIENWPQGTTADTYLKVCDEGIYKLLDNKNSVIFAGGSYVPTILYPGRDGFGDYVYLNIEENGKIKNWVCNDELLQEIIDDAFCVIEGDAE